MREREDRSSFASNFHPVLGHWMLLNSKRVDAIAGHPTHWLVFSSGTIARGYFSTVKPTKTMQPTDRWSLKSVDSKLRSMRLESKYS